MPNAERRPGVDSGPFRIDVTGESLSNYMIEDAIRATWHETPWRPDVAAIPEAARMHLADEYNHLLGLDGEDRLTRIVDVTTRYGRVIVSAADESVPPNEIHFLQSGRVVAKIVNFSLGERAVTLPPPGAYEEDDTSLSAGDADYPTSGWEAGEPAPWARRE
jgi:hypothetical protein